MQVCAVQLGTSGVDLSGLQSVLVSLGGADLVVLPEFAIGGLPHRRSDAEQRALTLPRLADVLSNRPTHAAVVVGFTERDRGQLYSSVAVLRNGAVIAHGRKNQPREPGLTPGDSHAVFEVAGLRCGVLICADATSEGPTNDLGTVDVLIICLNNDMSEAHAAHWRSVTSRCLADRARQTGAWVVSVDVAGRAPGREALGATTLHDAAGNLVDRSRPFTPEVRRWEIVL